MPRHRPCSGACGCRCGSTKLLDSRHKVTGGTIQVPLSYQNNYLDPRGRVIEIELRKTF